MDRSARWFWTGWGLSLLLGFIAPWSRVLSGTVQSAAFALYASAVISGLILVLVRRRWQAFPSALLMNLGGLTLGASLAFLSFWAISHKLHYAESGMKWLFFGSILTVAFVRSLKAEPPQPSPEFEPPNLEGLSREETEAAVKEYLDRIRPEIHRISKASNRMLWGGGLVLVGGVLCLLGISGLKTAPQIDSTVLAAGGTVLVLGAAGVVHLRRRVP